MTAEKLECEPIETALNEAKEALVRQEVLDKAQELLDQLQYTKGVEEELQAALEEKDPEKLKAIIDKIDAEELPIDPKTLDGAKGALAKMK